jgi:hypothetical protein
MHLNSTKQYMKHWKGRSPFTAKVVPVLPGSINSYILLLAYHLQPTIDLHKFSTLSLPVVQLSFHLKIILTTNLDQFRPCLSYSVDDSAWANEGCTYRLSMKLGNKNGSFLTKFQNKEAYAGCIWDLKPWRLFLWKYYLTIVPSSWWPTQ